MRSFSISSIVNSFKATLVRFPLALLFVAALFAYLEYYLLRDETPNGVVVYYFSAATIMSLLLHLLTEEGCPVGRKAAIFSAAHIILAIDALILYNYNDVDYNPAVFMAHGSVIVAFVLGIFFLPFVKEKDDIAAINFTSKTLAGAFMSWLVSGVVCVGVIALYQGFLSLFDVNVGLSCNEKIILTLVQVFLLLLSSLMWLARIPSGSDKFDRVLSVNKFVNSVIRFLFIPLVSCYMIVLYLYMFKVIAEWKLPHGTLTWMVSVMMSGLSMVLVMLYPTINHEASRYERLAARWLPLLAIPLVVLMTVGLIYRLGEYGITANRLYVATLAVWYYIICIGVSVNRLRRICWIPLTFGALFLLSSAHPWNYNEISRRVVTSRLSKIVLENPPMHENLTISELDEWLKSLPDSMGQRVYDDIHYLYAHKYSVDYGSLIEPNTYISGYHDVYLDTYETFFNGRHSSDIDVPSGVSKFSYFGYTSADDVMLEGDKLTFTLPLKKYNGSNETKEFHFTATINQIKSFESIESDDHSVLFVPFDCQLTKRGRLIVFYTSGLVFIKQ